MAKKDQAFDHPAYLARYPIASGEVGGGATTQYAKFASYTAGLLFSAQVTVTVAGTAAGHLISFLKISGTATSTIATTTLGTNTVGYTTNVLMTATGGYALLAGDVVSALTGADATGKAAVTYEWAPLPVSGQFTV
jgi:hypothetical protein